MWKYLVIIIFILDHEVEHDWHSAADVAPAAVLVLVLVVVFAGHCPVAGVQVDLELLA